MVHPDRNKLYDLLQKQEYHTGLQHHIHVCLPP